MRNKVKIAQIGTFDVENYGDLLFPTILKSELSEYDIDLFSPIGGKKPFEKETYVYKIKDLEKMVVKRNYKAIIIGGGDLIRLDPHIATKTYGETIDPAILVWQLPIYIGKKYNIPVIFNCPGVPYRFKVCEHNSIRSILENVDYLVVRDENSKKLLEECGLENIKVCPDSILNINNIIPKEELKKQFEKLIKNKKIPEADNYIAIQHNKTYIDDPNYLAEIKRLITLIINRYNYNVLLVPIGYVHNDIDFLRKLYDGVDDRIKLIENKLSPLEMLSVFANSEGYVGTSMHGAITSYAYDKPILVINCKRMVKMNGFLTNINMLNREVTDINNLCNIFEKNFFKKEKNDEKIKIQHEIEKHFLNIKNIIDKRKITKKNMYEFDFLKSVFSEFATIKDKNTNIIKVYFDYGEGFTESHKKEFKIKKNNNNELSLEFDIKSDVKQIRIDPFEGYVIKYEEMSITSKKKKVHYNIPNLFVYGDYKYIMSTDPMIIVDINPKIHHIKFNLKGNIMDYSDLLELMSSIIINNKKKQSQRKINLFNKIGNNKEKVV